MTMAVITCKSKYPHPYAHICASACCLLTPVGGLGGIVVTVPIGLLKSKSRHDSATFIPPKLSPPHEPQDGDDLEVTNFTIG